MGWLEEIAAEDLRHLYRGEEARQVKRRLIKAGFRHQISLYGALTNLIDQSSLGRRIEVFCDQPLDERLVMLVKEFFTELKPPRAYTIWALHAKELWLKQVAAYD